jgi:hypothetical protein
LEQKGWSARRKTASDSAVDFEVRRPCGPRVKDEYMTDDPSMNTWGEKISPRARNDYSW